jgi:glycosyltransferase involved in cell wall biosynthesis
MTAAAVVAPDRAIEQELIAAGYPAANIRCLAHGVPIPPPRTRAARTAARATLATAHPALAVDDWVPLVVYTGRLHRHKAVKTLVAAWEPIAARWPNARLWLAGDGPARNATERQIEAMNLGGRVKTVGVFDTVDVLLAAADLLVFPALEAGTSMSLLEAMAAGLPIVASDIPGHRSLVTDNRHGLLVPPGDAAAMSAAIGRLFDVPDLAQRLGAAARERAAAEFSIARMADEHLTLFHDLISARRGTTGEGSVRQSHP